MEGEKLVPLPPTVQAQRDILAKLTGEQFTNYGRNLDTVPRAWAWLADRRNWFKGQMWIIRWDGLTPTITENHGEKLTQGPPVGDPGLAECVVVGQVSRRAGAKDIEEESVVE